MQFKMTSKSRNTKAWLILSNGMLATLSDDKYVATSARLKTELEFTLLWRSFLSLFVWQKLRWQHVLLSVMKLPNISRAPPIKRAFSSCIATLGAESPLCGSSALQAKRKRPALWNDGFIWQQFMSLLHVCWLQSSACLLYRPATVHCLIRGNFHLRGVVITLPSERRFVMNTCREASSSFLPLRPKVKLIIQTHTHKLWVS